MLTVVTGRANAGKTGRLYSVVRDAAAAGRLPVVLLPTRPDARRTAEEFAAQGPVLGVQVTTVDACVDGLWTLYGDGRLVVGDTQRRVLLGRLIARQRLDLLGRSATRRGFLRLLENVVRGVDSLEHPAVSGGTPAAEIVGLISAYQELLRGEGLIERATVVSRLSQDMSDSWFDGPVVLNRFTDLTAAQERFLTAIGNTGDVWLSLPWERGFPATRALDGLIERLTEAGAALLEAAPQRHTHSDELAYLEEHLFMPPAEALGAVPSGDVRLSQAFGEEAEAERIAAEVSVALTEGVTPSRIAVVFRDPARHGAALRRALADAGIEARYDVLEHASRTGWGRAFVHLAEFASAGARAELIAFTRSAHSGVSRSTAERAEAYWRGARVSGGELLLADLGRLGGDAPRMIRLASRLSRVPVNRDSVQDWKSLADWLLATGAGGPNTPRIELLRDAAAHRAFTRVLGEMASLPQGSFTARDLMEMFLEERISADPDGGEGLVEVLSAERARARRFDVVIVGGLTAGDFPPRQTEDALSSADMKTALRDAGVDVGRARDQAAERLLFYLTVSRATKRLVLSRQVADSEGRELRPSWLLEELLDLYRAPDDATCPAGMPPVSTLGLDDSGEHAAVPFSARRRLRAAVAGGGHAGAADERRTARLRARLAHADRSLTDERLLEQMGARDAFSVTDIESYLACPYLWFFEREIRARPIGQEVDASLSGQLIHAALEGFYRVLAEQTGEACVTPANRERASAIAAHMVDELLAGQPEPRTLAERAAFATVKRKVVGFVAAEAATFPGFVVAATEVPFDTREASVDVGVDFTLRGRVDRIDRGPDGGLVLVDYKSGRVGSEYGQAAFEKRRRVQMPLYSLIVRQMLDAPVVAGLYRGVSGRNVSDKMNRGFYDGSRISSEGTVSRDDVDAEAIRSLEEDAVARATDAVAGIRAGRIAPDPRDKTACTYCGARGFCGKALS